VAEVSGSPVVQLSRSATLLVGSEPDFEHVRREFEREHCGWLPHLIESTLMQFIQSEMEQAEFRPRVHEGIGAEQCMDHGRVLELLHLVTNDPLFLGAIQRVTDCPPIGSFGGRIYRMLASSDHFDSWHDDMVPGDHRLLGMSVNLSVVPYSGGVFELRETKTRRMMYRRANTGLGEALVFRLSPHLQHRVTEVAGSAARTVFAGWFRSEPQYRSLLIASSEA